MKIKMLCGSKSVSLKINDSLAFPDAVTSRGTKHLKELESMIKRGIEL